MQKYHDEPKQYKGYLKSALGGLGLVLASAEIGHDALVDLASEETFQAPDDLSLGSAVRRAACHVINGRLMVPHADDDGSIEGGVGVAVAASLNVRR